MIESPTDVILVPRDAPVFSFRAECPYDFDQFVKAAVLGGIAFTILEVTKGEVIPDIIEPHVEIRTEATLERLRELLRGITDSHVMLQTLRPLPLSENPLNRDLDLE